MRYDLLIGQINDLLIGQINDLLIGPRIYYLYKLYLYTIYIFYKNQNQLEQMKNISLAQAKETI